MVEYWGSKDTQPTSNSDKNQADEKGRGSIIITNDNRHVYPNAPNEHANKPNWVEKGTFIILFLTLGAAGYAGYEANRLANLTETAVTDSEGAAAKQAADTAKSLQFAQEAADAAKTSAAAAGQSAKAANLGDRAWIAPRFFAVDGPPKEGQKMGIKIIYDNPGKTPALNAEFRAIARTIQKNDNSPVPSEVYTSVKLGPNESCNTKIIAPIGVVYPVSNIAGNVTHFDLDDLSLPAKLKAVTTVLGLQGCFEYETLKTKHQSMFCEYLEPAADKPIEQWQFKNCADGSDAN